MRELGRESWHFEIRGFDLLDFPLYVREALRLEVGVHRRVPQRTDTVPDRSGLLPAGSRDRASAAWLEWWDRLLAESAQSFDPDYAPPRSMGPGIESVLRRPVVQLWDDAATWPSSGERIDLDRCLPWETMARVAEEVAFDRSLRIGEIVGAGIALQAGGCWWYRLRPGLVVYTADAARDPALAPIIVRAAFDPSMHVQD